MRARDAVLVAVSVVVLASASAPAAQAANTWAGTWESDFGDLTLDAGGAGTYTGSSSGTISGGVSGNVNQGTWDQPGPPKLHGTYKFTLAADGRTFTGDWAYDGGGCGSACGWNGKCTKGACLQNGVPTAPPPPPPSGGPTCTPAARAFVAQVKSCTPGKLPLGFDVFFPVPGFDQTVDISPAPIPTATDELTLALTDAISELQSERIAAAIALKLQQDPKLQSAFEGCLMLAGIQDFVVADVRYGTKAGFAGDAALSACKKLVLDTPAAVRRAHAAAARCSVVFVPAFRKGRKVTKRMRTRAIAAARRQLSVTCTKRAGGGFTASIKPRRKGATLNKIVRTRIRAAAARRLPAGAQDAPGARMKLRWTARKR